jgi:hypothetical protein
MRPVTLLKSTLPAFLLLVFSAGMAQQFNFEATHYLSNKRTIGQIFNHGLPDTLEVTAPLYSGFNPADVKIKSVHDMIRFYVDHDTSIIASDYQYQMAVTVVGKYNAASTATFQDTLTINYNRGAAAMTNHAAYQDFYISKYSNFNKLTIYINSIFLLSPGGSTAPVDITTLTTLPGYNCALELAIWQQPYYKSPYGGAYPTSYLTSSYLSGEKALNVKFWNSSSPPPPSPAMYELEWTYVDDYDYNLASNSVSSLATSQLSYDFKNNATRIITDKTSYKIPVVYEKGYIVYRARIIRPDSINYILPVYTSWSNTNNTGLISGLSTNPEKYYYQVSTPHSSDSLNWQYTVSFAEEGKYKQVINYSDGSLKNRQTVTRFNSQPANLIATENIYDFKGRPAISILPTPVKDSGFHYLYGLSLNSVTSLPYKAADFDTLQPVHTCPGELSVSPLATAALANKYYSSQNTDTAGFQKFVPDAGGYPLVHTIISPEDDKKIMKQGGAGDSLQMGSGHFTRYDYVVPQQSELNRLFGTEAGRAEYYRKAVVTDPNGQAAYEITNNEGKKIATGMIGLGPDSSKHPIDSMILPGVSTINEDLLDGIQQTPVNYTWAVTKPFFVEASGIHTMQYILTVPPFPRCDSSIYLKVSASYQYEMFDDCGNVDHEQAEILGLTGIVNPPPGSGVNTGSVVSQYLDKGKHILNKTMTVSLDSVSASVDSFMKYAPATCLHNENWFIRKAVESHKFPCPFDTLDECGWKKKKMMQELYPGSKYGFYLKNSTGYMDSIGMILNSPNYNSIFDIFTPCHVAFYFQMVGGAKGFFCSAPVPIFPGPCHTFRFRVCDNIQWPDTVVHLGHKYWNIRYLPVDTFIMIFDTSMARALLPLHPEYCKKCDTTEKHYEQFLKAIPDYQTAIQLGYYTLNDIITKDPIYQNYGSNYYDSLKYLRIIHKAIDTLAIDMAYCSGLDTSQSRICVQQIFNGTITTNYYNMSSASATVKEAYWRRLMAIYLANRRMRMQYIEAHDNDTSCAPCDSVRMHLTPPPVYGPYTVSGTTAISDSTVWMQLFTNMSNGFSLPGWVASALSDTTNLGSVTQDSIQQLYNNVQYGLCDTAIAQMTRSLINCSLDTNKIKAIRDSLRAWYCSGPGAGKPYDPAVIRRIIINNGLSLTDICNPYLVNYSPYPFPQFDFGSLSCKPAKTYYDAREFFNDSPIHLSMNNRSTVSYVLNTSNYFQNLVAGQLSSIGVTIATTYDATLKIYRLEFTDTLNNKLNFWLKKMDLSGTCSMRLDSLNYWSVRDIMCLKEDAHNIFPSQINKYSFTARIFAIYGTDTVVCKVLGWSDKVLMLDEQTVDKTICITCPEVRKLYNGFKDTLNSYGVCCTDHPYYKWMVGNYLNYTLGKQYSTDEINNFIASCAVADSTVFSELFGQFHFSNMSDATLETLVGYLNTTYSTSVNFFRYKNPGATTNNLLLWFENLPRPKYLEAKQYITTNYSSYTYAQAIPSDTVAILFVPSGLTPTLPGTTGITGDTSTGLAKVYFSPLAAATYIDYKKYSIRYSTGMLPHQLLQYILSLKDYLYLNAPGSILFTGINPFVNDDYATHEKKDFLHYNYGLPDSLQHYELIKKVHEDTLKLYVYNSGANFTSTNYNNPNVTYDSPYDNKDYSDLFITDNNQTSHPGYQRVKQILDRCSTVNAGHIFYQAPMTIISLSPTSTSQLAGNDSLRVFRCGDNKTFWYRLFKADTSNLLYNFYLKIPDFVQNPSALTYGGIVLLGEGGDGNIFRMKVQLTDPVTSLSFFVYGYADFPVGVGKRLENSLLCRDMYSPWDIPDTMTCERYQLNLAIIEGKDMYIHYRDSVRLATIDTFRKFLYANVSEQFLLRTRDQKYHFTLYYYDRAGNLEKVISPAGVLRLDTSANATVNSHRTASTISSTSLPQHTKASFMRYNSLDKLTQEINVDAGTTNFFYDAVGRIVFSQTASQRAKGRVGYVLYDEQGRIIETGQGEYTCPTACEGCERALLPQVYNSSNMSLMDIRAFILARKREEVAATRYDVEDRNLDLVKGMTRQVNLRKRSSVLKYFESIPASVLGDTAKTYDFATHYSYDMSGNVKTLTHEFVKVPISQHKFKRVDYDYDMLSGKVNMLTYSRGFTDQYYHRYSYDADNRITRAESSNDGIYWDKDARYEYYQHGPLARAVIGDLRLQGEDYCYTIQGWLKAMNADLRDTSKDMGGDGRTNSTVHEDVFAYTLNYFKGDYRPIAHTPVTHTADITKSLFNGNISRQTTSLKYMDDLAKQYRYDPLNRLASTNYFKIDTNTLNPITAYRNTYRYDEDGNLLKLVRMGGALSGTAHLMDSFSYAHQLNASLPYNNRVGNIKDFADSANLYHSDIDYFTSGISNRLNYDESGRLTGDNINGQGLLRWSMYNKQKHAEIGTAKVMDFYYDGAGNRIEELVLTKNSDNDQHTRNHDYYVRDNSGNILAVMRYNEQLDSGHAIKHALLKILADNSEMSLSTIAAAYLDNQSFVDAVIFQTLGNASLKGGLLTSLPAPTYAADQVFTDPCKVIKGIDIGTIIDFPDPGPVTAIASALLRQAPMQTAEFYFNDESKAITASSLWAELAPENFAAFCTVNEIENNTDAFMAAWTEDPEGMISKVGQFFSGYSEEEMKPFIVLLLQDETFRAYMETGEGLVENWIDDQWEALRRDMNESAEDKDAIVTALTSAVDPYERLIEHFGEELMLRKRYQDNSATYMDAYLDELGVDGLAAAIDSIPGTSASKLLGDLYPAPAGTIPLAEVVTGESFSLAEHHIYGNKRLGIKYYWPSMGWTWDNTSGYIPVTNSWLVARVPWYSKAVGDFMKADSTINPPAFSFLSRLDYGHWFTSRMLGSKRYELSDHLGNVQSVIYDRHTIVAAGSVFKRFEPDVHLVMDYYPYGMPMKQEHSEAVEDTGIITYNKQVQTWTNTDLTPASYPPQAAEVIGNWFAAPLEYSANGTMNWGGTGAGMRLACSSAIPPDISELGMSVGFNTDASTGYTVTFSTDNDDAGELAAKVIVYNDVSHVEYEVLATADVPGSGNYEIDFTSTGDSAWLWVGRASVNGFDEGTKFKITAAMMYKYTWTPMQITAYSTTSNNNFYRFAYNGQERTDEKAGKANYYTAPYWEYDPRGVIRNNMDPKTTYGWSPYSVFGNNPILNSDPLGDEFIVSNSGKKDINGVAGRFAGALNYGPNGKVSINFDKLKNKSLFKNKDGNFDQQKFDAFKEDAKKDKGFSFIETLVNAKKADGTDERYYYGNQNSGALQFTNDAGGHWNPGRFEIPLRPGQTIDMNTRTNLFSEFGRNLSITPRDNNLFQQRPNGYDGAVFIVPANFYLMTTPQIKIPRAAIVYHELLENYLRTHHAYNYEDAHNMANSVEDRSFGNPRPGTVQKVIGK